MAAPVAGSIAFTGFNADGNDGFAFVAVDAIDAGQVIYFSQDEFNGTNFVDDNESVLSWTAPAGGIAAGTVIQITNVESNPFAAVANLGSVANVDTGIYFPGISGDAETIYAYTGTAAVPDVFVAAVSNDGFSAGALTGTGLVAGVTAVSIPTGVDLGVYDPATDGIVFADRDAALAAINDSSNWQTQNGTGDQDDDGIPPEGNFVGDAESPLNGVTFTIACYLKGTLIRTAEGDVPIETLRIGDRIVTASGAPRPIKWIGKRSYAGRFANTNPEVLPICFRAGSIAENVPARDLWISPKHAMLMDGVLIPASELINGVSVFQADRVEQIIYFHVELESHDVLLAEGAPSETFVDDNSRNMFHNVHEFHELYPAEEQVEAVYCAPRVTHGYALEAARRRLMERAGLPVEPQRRFGKLAGEVELCNNTTVAGWAQDEAYPDSPVCLDIVVNGAVVARTYADLKRGDGRRGFERALPGRSSDCVLVRRSADGAVLGAVRLSRAA